MTAHITLAAAYPLLTGDTMQPTTLPDTLPQLIVRRWTQALRVNNRADWRQMAELCGRTAIGIFCDKGYDADNQDFKAVCALARVAHLRGIACMTQARTQRECEARA